MKRGYEFALGTGLAITTLLGATACGGSKHANKAQELQTECVGLDFATPRITTGEALIYVLPKFNHTLRDLTPMTVSGSVVSGNDAGSAIKPQTGQGRGEFTFTWNPAAKALQHSVVAATVEFYGHEYPCPATTLTVNPVVYSVSPNLPKSPY